jgi:uncharacterized lipoprotein YbaY
VAAVPAGLGCGCSSGQGADLEQVVGEDPVAARDRGALPAIELSAVPAVAALEVADASFAADAPSDQLAEAGVVLGLAAEILPWRGIATVCTPSSCRSRS